MLRVGVFGAGGRMGAAVVSAVEADPGLELAAAVDPAHAGSAAGHVVVEAGPGAMEAAGVQVAVDFTVAAAALGNAAWCAEHGVHLVMGTTGFGEAGLAELRRLFEKGPANCVVAPNFAIGAVLMMRFAEMAAPWFETVELVEVHHDAKLDAPSGTALLAAQRIAQAKGASAANGSPASAGEGRPPKSANGALPARGAEPAPGVHVHSLRLRGFVAHHEVLFGTTGQALTVRHDSFDRTSFMPGVLLAVKEVPNRRGLTVGLDSLLGL